MCAQWWKKSGRYPQYKTLLVTLWARANGKCALCGEDIELNQPRNLYKRATVDHIIPRSQGGSHEISNLQIAHHWCNSERKTIPMSEWDKSKIRPFPVPKSASVKKNYVKISAENIALYSSMDVTPEKEADSVLPIFKPQPPDRATIPCMLIKKVPFREPIEALDVNEKVKRNK